MTDILGEISAKLEELVDFKPGICECTQNIMLAEAVSVAEPSTAQNTSAHRTELQVADVAQASTPSNPHLDERELNLSHDSSLVNLTLDLKPFRLEQFMGIYPESWPAEKILFSITHDCKLECCFDFYESGPDYFRVSLQINKVHVSYGSGSSLKLAKRSCASNSLQYLQSKGLQVLLPSEIETAAIERVSKSSLSNPDGEDLSEILEERIISFTRNTSIIKLEFCDFDHSDCETIQSLAGDYNLKHKSGGEEKDPILAVWKCNSVIHNISVKSRILSVPHSTNTLEKEITSSNNSTDNPIKLPPPSQPTESDDNPPDPPQPPAVSLQISNVGLARLQQSLQGIQSFTSPTDVETSELSVVNAEVTSIFSL